MSQDAGLSPNEVRWAAALLRVLSAHSLSRGLGWLDRVEHGTCRCVCVAAYNMATLDEEVGLYSPGVVQRITDRHRFTPWSSDAHVAPLYYSIVEAWNENSELVKDERYYVHFSDATFGADLRVLAPVVRHENPEHCPRWSSPLVPFCHHKFQTVSSSS